MANWAKKAWDEAHAQWVAGDFRNSVRVAREELDILDGLLRQHSIDPSHDETYIAKRDALRELREKQYTLSFFAANVNPVMDSANKGWAIPLKRWVKAQEWWTPRDIVLRDNADNDAVRSFLNRKLREVWNDDNDELKADAVSCGLNLLRAPETMLRYVPSSIGETDELLAGMRRGSFLLELGMRESDAGAYLAFAYDLVTPAQFEAYVRYTRSSQVYTRNDPDNKKIVGNKAWKNAELFEDLYERYETTLSGAYVLDTVEHAETLFKDAARFVLHAHIDTSKLPYGRTGTNTLTERARIVRWEAAEELKDFEDQPDIDANVRNAAMIEVYATFGAKDVAFFTSEANCLAIQESALTALIAKLQAYVQNGNDPLVYRDAAIVIGDMLMNATMAEKYTTLKFRRGMFDKNAGLDQAVVAAAAAAKTAIEAASATATRAAAAAATAAATAAAAAFENADDVVATVMNAAWDVVKTRMMNGTWMVSGFIDKLLHVRQTTRLRLESREQDDGAYEVSSQQKLEWLEELDRQYWIVYE